MKVYMWSHVKNACHRNSVLSHQDYYFVISIKTSTFLKKNHHLPCKRPQFLVSSPQYISISSQPLFLGGFFFLPPLGFWDPSYPTGDWTCVPLFDDSSFALRRLHILARIFVQPFKLIILKLYFVPFYFQTPSIHSFLPPFSLNIVSPQFPVNLLLPSHACCMLSCFSHVWLLATP